MHFGIDYGSKMAGTTVICYNENGHLKWIQSPKKKDADEWILHWTQALKPEHLFIDAPLSLPMAYYQKGDNFHYRKADQLLNAMSPMFLGGLTARAMRLKNQLIKSNSISVTEVYPAALAKNVLEFNEYYNKKSADAIIPFFERIKHMIPKTEEQPENWHQVDAILAWISGKRYLQNEAISFGNLEEGQIWV